MKIFLKIFCFLMVTMCAIALCGAAIANQYMAMTFWVVMGAVASSVKDKVWQLTTEKPPVDKK
jgi:hypothetical protein